MTDDERTDSIEAADAPSPGTPDVTAVVFDHWSDPEPAGISVCWCGITPSAGD